MERKGRERKGKKKKGSEGSEVKTREQKKRKKKEVAASKLGRTGLFIHCLTVLRDKPWTRSFCSQSLNCKFVWTDGHVRRQTCSTYDRQKPPRPWKSCDRLYIVDRSRETSVSIPGFVPDRLRSILFGSISICTRPTKNRLSIWFLGVVG